MKRYRITIGEQTFDVSILSDPRQPRVLVEVDGERLDVETKVSSDAEVDGAAEGRAGSAGRADAVATPAASGTTGGESGSNLVTSPLPGIIKSIAVRPGQQVSANEELVVIEAMKMDNIIRASRSGKIGAVLVTEGRQVAYGAPLIEYKD